MTKTPIGAFLIRRLREIGVGHVFGVPGDFNLQFLDQIYEDKELQFIGTCNELNAAYAADGYARRAGAGAILTTYGVGELSAINGVAGSACEHVPVVAITGAPPLYAMEEGWLLHHTLADGNYDNMMEAMRQFTVAGARLTPRNAAAEIDRVLLTCWREKMPVYLQLPSNISHLEIDVPDTPLPLHPGSDSASLKAAAQALIALWEAAERPAILTDMDAARYGLGAPLREIVDGADVPFAAMTTGKAILPEVHPRYLGLYNGAKSEPGALEAIEQSDCLIVTAPRFIEVNSGHFTANLPKAKLVTLQGHSVRIGAQVFEAVEPRELLGELIAHIGAEKVEREAPARAVPEITPEAKLTHARLWPRLAAFVQPGDVVVAESGTSNIGMTPQRLPEEVSYVAQNIWGSIGYTLPACFGSAFAAAERRHVLFIGDGSFQLTAQELSTMLIHDQKPVIFLLNNRGYTIERYILGWTDRYNDVANWDYAALPGVFAERENYEVARVGTEGELEAALERAEACDKLMFIEMALDPFDAPKALHGFGPATADFDYGPHGPQDKPEHQVKPTVGY